MTEHEDEIVRLRGLLEVERRVSRTDLLTGLGNARTFAEALDGIRRVGGSVLLFDAANLKAANTALGHAGADRVLKTLGQCVRSGSGDAVCTRQGGDEFAVFLPSTPVLDALYVLRRIQSATLPGIVVARGVCCFLDGWVARIPKGCTQTHAAHRLNAADRFIEAIKVERKSGGVPAR